MRVLVFFALLFTSTSVFSAEALASEFRAGFGSHIITPPSFESWEDVDGNARYDETIDRFDDANGNGVFDAVWMAGFHKARAARDVHDDLMTVAVVFDDGTSRIGIVTADTVGLMESFVIDLRRDVPATLGLDYVLVHATHNHEGPDTQGLWGPSDLTSGLDPTYMNFLKEEMIAALGDAVAALEPARLKMATLEGYDAELGTMDTRAPIVLDPGIRVLMLQRADDSVIGTLVNYGMHVELAWDMNLSLTADLAGYMRRGVSDGLVYDGEVVRPGIGGTTMWLTGNIGGLMTSLPGEPVHDPWLDRDITASGYDKSRAFGYGVASAVLTATLSDSTFYEDPAPTLAITTRPLTLPMTNYPLALASLIGLIDRDVGIELFPPQLTLRSEVALLKIGEARLVAIPGELYPEIAVGGITNPEGADFSLSPVETPPLRSAMQGRVNLMVNLANDAIGYIIPKSEWDNEAPWISPVIKGDEGETYGEIVSVGPETAPVLHRALLPLLQNDGS